MAFDAIAFLSGASQLSEREKSLVKRMTDRDVLFLVTGSESKSEALRDYILALGSDRMNVIFLHNNDSRYILPYLARETSKKDLIIDITFASSYYASAVTLIARRPGVSITYTPWDGVPQVIYRSLGPKTEYNDINYRIVKRLSSGPRTLAELEKETGLNYKTLARRAAILLKDGAISKTDDYPIRYYATDEQVLACQLSPNPYDAVAEGTVFLNAAEALFTQDRVVLDNTIPAPLNKGEYDIETRDFAETGEKGFNEKK